MNEPKRGVRHYIELRRTVVQTQSVDFIAAGFIGSEQQHAVAAAYARPEAWIDERDDIVVVNLTTEHITWESE
jgi:hypothetical protein